MAPGLMKTMEYDGTLCNLNDGHGCMGKCFVNDPAVDRQIGLILTDAYQSTASCIYAAFRGVAGAAPQAPQATQTTGPVDVAAVTAALAGHYVFTPPPNAGYAQNDWHIGDVVQDAGGLRWVNRAGSVWKLVPDVANLKLHTGADNPYFKTNPDIGLALVGGRLQGLLINGGMYAKAAVPATAPPAATGMAQCQEFSDKYAVVAYRGFGFAPADVRSTWIKLGCTTVPSLARVGALCQQMSNQFRIVAMKTYGSADAQVQGSWAAMNCNTSPN
jgi:hypothetical protein